MLLPDSSMPPPGSKPPTTAPELARAIQRLGLTSPSVREAEVVRVMQGIVVIASTVDDQQAKRHLDLEGRVARLENEAPGRKLDLQDGDVLVVELATGDVIGQVELADLVATAQASVEAALTAAGVTRVGVIYTAGGVSFSTIRHPAVDVVLEGDDPAPRDPLALEREAAAELEQIRDAAGETKAPCGCIVGPDGLVVGTAFLCDRGCVQGEAPR